jgi:hypothetical protein
MIAWALLFLTAIFSHSAEAFGPNVDTDQIATSFQLGSQFMLQSVSVNKHFTVRDDAPNSYFVLQENPQLADMKMSAAEQEKYDKDQRDLLNLAWMLGYLYYSSSSNQVYDEAHAIEIGLAWEAAKMFDFTVAGAYQVMPAENFSQGIFNLDFEFTIPLKAQPAPPQLEGATDDAEAYYVNKAIEADLPKNYPKDRFPNFKIGVLANFYRGTKSQTSSGRVVGSTIGGDQQMNEAASGPNLTLNFNRKFYIHADYLLYYYDTSPTGFLGNFTIGPIRRKADLAVASLEGTQAFLLNYPNRSLDASFGYRFNNRSGLRVGGSYSTYNATSNGGGGYLTSTFALAGMVDFVVGRRWKLGVLADVTLGTASYSAGTGGLTLGYAL